MKRLHANLHDDLGFEVARRVELGEDPDSVFAEIYHPRMVRGDVHLQFYTVGGDAPRFCGSEDLLRGTLRRIDLIREIVARRGDYRVVTHRESLDACRSQSQRALVLTVEGALPVGYDLGVLRSLHALGLRSVCLLWFRANQIGDGVGEERNGGLTSFGREFVAEANRLGLLLDLAQASTRTIDDVLCRTKAPVIASHCNAKGRYNHPRNLSDDHIRAIAAGGGLIGLTSYPAHVGPDPTLAAFVDHLDYVVDLVGVAGVALGLNIIAGSFEEETRFFQQSKIEYSGLWLRGLEDVDHIPALAQVLQQRGYRASDIDLILGGNVVRLLNTLLV